MSISLPMYSIITQKKIALALRNDLISCMHRIFEPSNTCFSPMEKLYISFWWGQSQIQKYVDWLDPDFPNFDPEKVLDAYVFAINMIDNATDFYAQHEHLKGGTGTLVTTQDFSDGISSGLYDDNEGHGCFSDGVDKWTRHLVETADFEELMKAWPGFTYVIWYEK